MDAYVSACREEVEALKPGNVHIFAEGHGMVVQQFLTSAEVSAGPLTEPGWPIGRRVLEAVKATRAAVGVNTNLGILLLCGPILAAAESRRPIRPGSAGPPLQAQIANTLQSFTMDDARDVFAAIAHASPAGLGDVEDDVREPPRIGLLEAMAQAANRDRIAWQYTHGFADIFDVGLVELDAAKDRGEAGMWLCVFAYLAFLTSFPDSHIARKFDENIALQVREEARSIRSKLDSIKDESSRIELLSDFDRALKAQNLNPGTSADLTVASLLVRNLRDSLHIPVDDA